MNAILSLIAQQVDVNMWLVDVYRNFQAATRVATVHNTGLPLTMYVLLQQRVQMSVDEIDGLRHRHKIIKCRVSRCLPLKQCEEQLVRALISVVS